MADEKEIENMAQALRKAMKGFGTDEKALIDIIGPASNRTLVQLKAKYNEVHKRDLMKDIKSETGGRFEDVLVGLLMDKIAYDAATVRKSIKGWGTDEDLLTEILCTRTPEEIQMIVKAYKAIYKRDMLSDIEDDTSGDYQKLCNLIIVRPSECEAKVEEDVEALYNAGEKRLGTNEGVFIRLLAGNPRSYTEQLYWAYAEKYGKALDRVIKSEFAGPTERALIALSTPLDIYYKDALTKSMKGLGTDDTSLIRLIVTQKERNLPAASKLFLQDNKETVKRWVEKECGGDYKRILVSVIENWS